MAAFVGLGAVGIGSVHAERFSISENAVTPSVSDTHHPGEGRGPVGKVVVTGRTWQCAVPNWAPAFAGVVLERSDCLQKRSDPGFVLCAGVALHA